MQTILQAWVDRLNWLTLRMAQLSQEHSSLCSVARETFNRMYSRWYHWRCRIVAVARRNQYRVDLRPIIDSLEDNRLVMGDVQRTMSR